MWTPGSLHQVYARIVTIGEFSDGPITGMWPHLYDRFIEGAKACPVPCVYEPNPTRGGNASIRASTWLISKNVQKSWLDAPESQTRLLLTLEPWVPQRHLPIDMFVSFHHLSDVRLSYVYSLTSKCKCKTIDECRRQRYCTETRVSEEVGKGRQDGAIGAFFVSNCGNEMSGKSV